MVRGGIEGRIYPGSFDVEKLKPLIATYLASLPVGEIPVAFKDEGVEALIGQMESSGQYFYKTADHPDGLVGADHVVIIKINNQWGGDGDGYGKGTLRHALHGNPPAGETERLRRPCASTLA